MNENLQERLYYQKNREDPAQIVLGFVRAMARWEAGCNPKQATGPGRPREDLLGLLYATRPEACPAGAFLQPAGVRRRKEIVEKVNAGESAPRFSP